MSLSVRLTALVGTIVAGAIAIAAGVGYVLTARELTSEVDDFLRERAASMWSRGTVDGPFAPRLQGVFEPDAVVQIVNASGDVSLVIEGNPRLPVVAGDIERAREGLRPVIRNVEVEGRSYRMLTAPLANGGAVLVARDLAEVEGVLSGLRIRLLLVLLGGTGLAGAIGWEVARRTVAPVEGLTETAEVIAETQDLSTPIPVSGTDEVGRLASSFNVMLAALDGSRRKQRQLVLDAGHELRTPLTSLRTNIELLQRADDMDAAERRAVMDAAVAELGELTELVNELIELATEHDVSEPLLRTRLGEIAERAVARARRRTDRPIELHADGEAEVEVRAGQVERAISNLIGNALKFSDGAVTVNVSGAELDVLDEGPGIPVEDRDRVFDRFYRATSARTMPGSGLGLAIVKQVVESHGGAVRTGASASGGAAVGFSLPAAR